MDDLLMQCVMSFFGVMAFAALFKAPSRLWIHCGVVGMVAWLIYLLVLNWGGTVFIAAAVSMLGLMSLSRAMSAWFRVPGTVFVVAGIFPLVPGVGIYYTVYYIMIKEMELAGAKGRETMSIALALAVGILLGNLVPQSWYNKLGRLNKRKA